MKILSQLEQKLTERKKIKAADFQKLQAYGSHAYKVYTIPKRKAGNRIIAHPSFKLKECQRELVSVLENYFPVHNSAFAYVKGKSIKTNALVHAKSDYLLKMDFQDFFNSITPKVFEQHLKRLNIDIPYSDFKRLEQLIFWNPSKRKYGKLILSVGSPISPFLSNTIMYFFDEKISKLCFKNKINYSRYADDLTFSTTRKDILFHIPALIKKVLQEEFHGAIIVNERKTIFSSKAHNRHVTGITINNENQISLGRKRKRHVSSLVFKFLNNSLPDEDIEHLIGLLSFCFDIEPSFVHRLSKKYNYNIIDNLLHRRYIK